MIFWSSFQGVLYDDMELDKTLTMYADMMSRLITDILLNIVAELSCNYE